MLLFTLQRCEFFSKSQPASCSLPLVVVVVYLAKVRIFQQITTFVAYRGAVCCCCLPCKGANFSANHNPILDEPVAIVLLFTLQRCEFFSKSQLTPNSRWATRVVVYLAKVRIFQQITTQSLASVARKLLFTLQRCEFFSKSQHVGEVACVDKLLFTLQRCEFFSKSQPIRFTTA